MGGLAARPFLIMCSLREMKDRINSFDTKEVLMEVFMDNKETAAEKNVEQLQGGKDIDGNTLKPYASAEYAAWKHSLNPEPGKGNPDLKVTGNYWKTIQTQKTGQTQYEMNSNESSDKVSFLDKHYNRKQYGLNEDGTDKFINEAYRQGLKDKFGAILKTD